MDEATRNPQDTTITCANVAVAVLGQEHEDPLRTNQLDLFHPELHQEQMVEA